jgi:hypothetical protein
MNARDIFDPATYPRAAEEGRCFLCGRPPRTYRAEDYLRFRRLTGNNCFHRLTTDAGCAREGSVLSAVCRRHRRDLKRDGGGPVSRGGDIGELDRVN